MKIINKDRTVERLGYLIEISFWALRLITTFIIFVQLTILFIGRKGFI